ncbi:hypothetical protein C1S82_14820 [Mycolicibacterium cosmeticum]|uniref:Uncharacterized protein n=1 Tax=Mycolicibacterium cosmeticum TaxID=258533 RepID=W9BL21_MYCCO|nr:hypothetical protein [Mycolicibacterium cosmeticum]TLH73255.1 hypothetical protein C1S82_14820 [Mycolicibacterium cosmeticum]CDO08890.1 hypothetical protein BN977_03710 [Mycolicibacterium cosmeticum]
MTDTRLAALLTDVLDAHGGLTRWQAYDHLDAELVSGGLLYDLKGQHTDQTPRRVRVRLGRIATSIEPFGAADQRLNFTATRTAIEKLDGTVVAEGADVRPSFAGHTISTSWTALQRAYFSGYALWNYLNCPFLLSLPQIRLHPLEPVEHRGVDLVGIGAEFPANVPAHSRRQRFYFDAGRLLRRHDYRVDIAGSFPASQFLSDYTIADGFPVALSRRAFRTNDTSDLVCSDTPMVAMRFTDIRFSK